jgi:hypothetical protein
MQPRTNRLLALLGVLLLVEVLSSVPATAGPVGGGTLTPVNFQFGGTVSGSFSLDSLGNMSTWSISVTSGPGFSPNATSATTPDMTFPAFTYTESNSIGHFFSGTDLTTVDVRTTNWPAAQNRDLAFAFGPLPSVIPSQGVALQICSDVDHPCFSGGIQVPSGEEISDPSTAHPFGVDTRQMLTGFMTVSDPPGSISFNFTLEPVLFEVNPGPVPEPTTLLLLVGSGLAGIVGARRRKRL